MSKILLIDQTYTFTADVESRMILNDIMDIDLMTLNNVEDVFKVIENNHPDKVIINASILEFYPDWNLSVPVISYARNMEDLSLSAMKKIPCYGVVNSAEELLMAIQNDSIIQIKETSVTQEPVRQEPLKQERERIQTKKEEGKSPTLSQPLIDPDDWESDFEIPETVHSGNTIQKNIPSEQSGNKRMEHYASTVYEESNPEEDSTKIEYKPKPNHSVQDSTVRVSPIREYPSRESVTAVSRNNQKSIDESDEYDFRAKLVKAREEERQQKMKEAEQKAAKNAVSRDMGEQSQKAKVITVYSAKGGVGKTTLACELAVYLALTDHGRGKYKVCIADFNIDFGDVMATLMYDPQKFCMTMWADEIRERLSKLPVNKNGKHSKEQLNSIQYSSTEIMHWLQKNEENGLYALLAPTSNEDSMDISGEELDIMMQNLINNGGFDFVICDTGNNTRDSSYMPLLKSDEVFLVVTQNFNTVNCNHSVLNMLHKVHFDMNKVSLVINKVKPKKSVGIGTEEVEDALINPLTDKPYPCIAKIKDSNDIKQANNSGEPLVYNPSHEFTKSIGKIASKIIGNHFVLEQPKKKGFFAKMFKKS